MQDKRLNLNVSLPCTIAWVAWVVTAALMAVGVWTHDGAWRDVALVGSAAAATLSVRAFCVKLNHNLKAAYTLGRQVGKEQRALASINGER